jgi:hypothetical protein
VLPLCRQAQVRFVHFLSLRLLVDEVGRFALLTVEHGCAPTSRVTCHVTENRRFRSPVSVCRRKQFSATSQKPCSQQVVPILRPYNGRHISVSPHKRQLEDCQSFLASSLALGINVFQARRLATLACVDSFARVAQWLRHYAVSREVAGSRPDEVLFFNLPKSSASH